jgi:hypothetical protein
VAVPAVIKFPYYDAVTDSRSHKIPFKILCMLCVLCAQYLLNVDRGGWLSPRFGRFTCGNKPVPIV